MYRVNLGLVLITLVIALVSIYQGWLNRRQLTIATTPYLQITNIRPTIEYGKAAKITFEIDNLTKIPTKIIGANLGDSVSGQRRSISNSIKTYNPYSTELRASDQVNRYDIEGSPYEDTYIAGYILDGHAYSDLTSNSGDQAFLYFYGTINYVNQVNNDERAYQFEVKITLCPAYRLETVTNANYSTD